MRRSCRARIGLVGGGLALLAACTVTVVPPPSPRDPVEVLVLSEALHVGLVLPPDPDASSDGDQYVEFGFGDWSWFALGNEEWYRAFGTVLWPTPGALGRRTFGATTAAELRAAAYWTQLASVQVERSAALALRRQLQADFDAGRGELVDRRALRFRFVPHERAYWWPNNCVDRTADWLEALGCEVGWLPLRSGLSVDR